MPRGPGPYIPKKCCVRGCKSIAAKYRKMCFKHITRVKRNGSPNVVKKKVHFGSPIERVMQKIKQDKYGCWNWTGYLDDRGYGLYRFTDGSSRVHRWIYEKLVSHISRELTLDHLCRNPRCINPGHLEPVTIGENLRRGAGSNGKVKHCRNGHEIVGKNLVVIGENNRCKICLQKRDKSLINSITSWNYNIN